MTGTLASKTNWPSKREPYRYNGRNRRQCHRFEAPGFILHADVKVILAVVRSRVNEARAGFEGDVVAENDGTLRS